MQVSALVNEIAQHGVHLYLNDAGQLAAKGGADFPEELRRAAAARKDELTAYMRRHKELIAAEAQWTAHFTKANGYRVKNARQSGVVRILRDRYLQTRFDYLEGRQGSGIEDVYLAFKDYAKSTRMNYFANQLEGDVYAAGKRTPQRLIQKAFEEGKLRMVRRKAAAPQIDPAMDQIERMRVYFGIDPEEYALSRIGI
jgi:hypothetical protein